MFWKAKIIIINKNTIIPTITYVFKSSDFVILFFPINIVILDAIVLKINLIPAKKAEIKYEIKSVVIKPVFITNAIATFAPLLRAVCKN